MMKLATFSLTLLFCFSTAALCQSPSAETCKLIVHIDGFRNQKGNAGITVFTSPAGWPENNDKAFIHSGHPFTGDKATFELRLPAGRYAIAALHDENSNHKLDRNMLGWPKEGFGFSNNPKVNLSAPGFNTAAMQITCPVTETTIHLIYK
ncbi:MAG TPA: DUF2141 domain-containing protein [Acidobacteriaceae bacterium]|nr:DUF2141 domain-containing protein [Acidobacteriaceae bacterium]